MKWNLIVAASAFLLVLFVVAIATGFYLEFNNKSQAEVGEGLLDDSLKMFTEQDCVDGEGDVKCTEKTYVQCKDGGLKVPVMTGYTVKEKILVPEYVETERVIYQDKKPSGEEMISPADRITEEDITAYSSYARIDLKNAKWRMYVDSNSMDPLIDEDTTTLEIKPEQAADIHIGDIIAYNAEGYDYALVHRVIKIGEDEKGIYFITKGDNFWKEDPYKVRFPQIEGIIVGILY